MLQKYQGDDLLHLCAIYEPQNADNARTFGI